MMKLPPYIMVIDVKSVGLYGEAFAVGGVVVSTDPTAKKPVDSFLYACPSSVAVGRAADRAWVERNVRIKSELVKAGRPDEVCAQFWVKWLEWKSKGAWMAADVPYPCETRFLAVCCAQTTRQDDAPYPLLDVASILFAAGRDPLLQYPRLKGELPANNPLADARQSARLLLEALAELRAQDE